MLCTLQLVLEADAHRPVRREARKGSRHHPHDLAERVLICRRQGFKLFVDGGEQKRKTGRLATHVPSFGRRTALKRKGLCERGLAALSDRIG